MILSRPAFWAVAAALGRLGAAEGRNHMNRHDQPPSPTVISAPTSVDSSSQATSTPVFFNTTWPTLEDGQFSFVSGSVFNINYSLPQNAPSQLLHSQTFLTLVLLWTSATSGAPTSDNTWDLTNVTYTCDENPRVPQTCSFLQGATGVAHLDLISNPASSSSSPQASDPSFNKNFFLCFATAVNPETGTLVCESYSDFFFISDHQAGGTRRSELMHRQNQLTKPTGILPITQMTDFLIAAPTTTPAPNTLSTPSSASSSKSDGYFTTTTGGSTIFVESVAPTGTTTITPGATPTGVSSSSASASSKSKSSSLGIGPIVGIAIAGAAALIVLALVAFFCRRRRRRNGRPHQPEQVLLTHDVHNLSRDLAIEKISPSDSAGPMLPSILETRPSSGPYDHLETSAPYSGPAGKRTTLQAHSDLTRALSNASLGAPVSPRSTRSHPHRDLDDASSYNDDNDIPEPYSDVPVPVYGDARHTPQIYPNMNMQAAPFLHEPGMTEEELSRLEDEERRIDAAIAAAEAGRRR